MSRKVEFGRLSGRKTLDNLFSTTVFSLKAEKSDAERGIHFGERELLFLPIPIKIQLSPAIWSYSAKREVEFGKIRVPNHRPHARMHAALPATLRGCMRPRKRPTCYLPLHAHVGR